MKFFCSSCGAEMVAPEGFEGMPVDCTRCGEKTSIPLKKSTTIRNPAASKELEPLAPEIDPGATISVDEVEWLKGRMRSKEVGNMDEPPSPEGYQGNINSKAWPIPSPDAPEPSISPVRESTHDHIAKHAVNGVCPICDVMPLSSKSNLYGQPVCDRCHYGLTNRRGVAFAVDYFLFSFAYGFLLILFLQTLPASTIFSAKNEFWNGREMEFFSVVPVWLWPLAFVFFAAKDGFLGYSPGKWLMGIRVVNSSSGQPIGFRDSIVRNALIALFSGQIACAFIVAVVVGLVLKEGYRPGDGWAKTKVIRWKYRDKAPFKANP